jgi:tetratricopeptide (TPR) repeat protein
LLNLDADGIKERGGRYMETAACARARILPFAFLLSTILGVSGCGLSSAAHQADAAYRRAIAAHLAGDLDQAAAGYVRVIRLGHPTAATWNNLGAVYASRGHYRQARRLIGQAVALDGENVVALVNYGVLSYHLFDFGEAERAFQRAKRARAHQRQAIPSIGRADWDGLRYDRETEPLAERAERYLRRIAAGAAPRHAGLYAQLMVD